MQHRIETGTATPIRFRRISPAQQEEARRLIQDMLQKDVIQPSTSLWASPIVLVHKKNGAMHFCVDYRKVNAVTREDTYPLPRIDDTLDTLAGSRWFTTLDSNLWLLASRSLPQTPLSVHLRVSTNSTLCLSSCNAPTTFQRLMDAVLAGLQWINCLVYLDDVVIIRRSFKEHLSNLRNVF